MNIHHLELFYYVARHGGIAAAARRMPYGIQQPAISVQLIQLEQSLGTTLFRRQPFELTRTGKSIFAFVEPFFSKTAALADEIRGEAEGRVRIGASQVILRDYLPRILSAVRKRVPKLRVVLREDYPHDLLKGVEDGEIDLAITCIESRPPTGFRKLILAKLHPCLLFPKETALSDWSKHAPQNALIALPQAEPLCRAFQRELKRRDIEWPPMIEVSSLELIATYVREGFGVGLSFALPGPAPAGLRCVPLDDFPMITVAALWRNLPSRPGKILLQELREHAALRRL